MMNAKEESTKLKQEAENFLKETQVVSKLEKYGDVNIAGSYDLDLMVWPDIDIQLDVHAGKDRLRAFSDMSYEFMNDTKVRKLKLINFVPGKKPGMPTGVYMGLDFKVGDRKWKVDVWALDKEHRVASDEYAKQIKKKLNEDNRGLILNWKYKMLVDGRVPQLGSYMLYRAILLEELNEDEDIFNYLVENKVNLSHLQS